MKQKTQEKHLRHHSELLSWDFAFKNLLDQLQNKRYSPKIRQWLSAVWAWPWWTDRCRLLGSLSSRAPQLSAHHSLHWRASRGQVLGLVLWSWGVASQDGDSILLLNC